MNLLNHLKRPIPNDPAYTKRLELELRLVKEKKFEPMFQQVLEILELTKDLPHLIRGSAGSSLLCYLLGITAIDPIKEKIPLSRFMSDLREDIPDVDLDFSHKDREEVFRRIYAKWGNRVARISNYICYREKGALREALRQFGYRHFIPRHFDLSEIAPGKEELIVARANRLLGERSTISLHCGGIVIFDQPIPREKLVKPGQIQLDKDEVENAGLYKIDILSNRALSELVEISDRPIEDYPEEDEATSALLSRGDVLGITLGESPAFRKVMMALQPTKREHVILGTALLRPAAASRNRKKRFLTEWRQGKRPDYIVYDDDAIFLIQRLTGCSEAEADRYRKGFAKNNPEIIADFCKQVGPHPKLDQWVEDLSQLNSYSFCKSHAIAYGRLIWALAYQKAHNPEKFWVSALNNCCSMYRDWVHYQEAKKYWKLTAAKKGPWTPKNGKLYSGTSQKTLFEDPLAQYKKRGYWIEPEFWPGMYCKEENGEVEFRGLIATGRNYSVGNGRYLTFITAGIENHTYVDLVLPDTPVWDAADIIKGKGRLRTEFGSTSVDVLEYELETI